jgi:hypothetical protein
MQAPLMLWQLTMVLGLGSMRCFRICLASVRRVILKSTFLHVLICTGHAFLYIPLSFDPQLETDADDAHLKYGAIRSFWHRR